MNSMQTQGKLSRASVGEFSASDWKSEGHALLLSSKLLRLQWLISRRKLARRLREDNFGTVGFLSKDIDLMNMDRSLVKSSTLLIGYAVEMYLKAGLASALTGGPEDLFIYLSKYRFKHNYCEIANFISYPLTQQDKDDFETLKNAVEFDARYPISVASDEDYISKFNERRQRLADNSRYKRYRRLVEKLDRYSIKLRGTGKDPLSHGDFEFDGDGYLFYRMGGGMPSRITYKLGSGDAREFSCLNELKDASVGGNAILRLIWEKAEIYEQRGSGKKIKFDKVSE